MALELRPLTLAELLDRSFSTYKRHFWLFVGIMAVPASLGLLYAVSMQLLQFAIAPPMDAAAATTPPRPEQVFRLMLPVVLGALAFFAVYIVLYAFALGATTIAVAHLYKGQPVTVATAFGEVRRHGWRLVVLLLWIGLRLIGALLGWMVLGAVFGALLALISPFLAPVVILVTMVGTVALMAFVTVRYGVAVPAVVLENQTARRALARSVELTEDHRGRVFLLMLCAIVIAYATTLLLQGPFLMGAMFAGPGSTTALALTLVGAVFGTVGSMFSGPIMIIGLAMLYYDLRIRKEALDLQMMLEALDAPRA